MKLVGWIQARMGSTRLPGKVMMPLAGKPVIWHIAERLTRVPHVSGIVLATTQDPGSDEMVNWARSQGWHITRAEAEDDIAGRMALSIEETGADAILKVNADCPLVDVGVMSQLVDLFRSEDKLDYVSNKHRFTYPIGLSAEVISTRAICYCNAELTSPHDREYAAGWIKDHPELFLAGTIENKQDLSYLELTLDTATDYEEMCRIFDALFQDGEVFGLSEVLEQLDRAQA